MKILSKIRDEPDRKIEVLLDRGATDQITIRQWTAGATRERVDISMSLEEAKKLAEAVVRL